jgi:hypothetical protein
MEKLTTRELYNQLQERIIINLNDNEIICPECKALRFIFVERNGSGYIESCSNCYNGKLYVCKHCGKSNKTDHCQCKESNEERHNDFRIKQTQKELEAYQKAEKISYKDYNGYYILSEEEHLKEHDDLEEWIYEKLVDGEVVPEFLWAVEGFPHASIDLKDVISDKCEDGYEDMYSHLDTNSPLLVQAQELINQWEKEQGDRLCVFNETYEKAVIIKDLVEKIREEINKG